MKTIVIPRELDNRRLFLGLPIEELLLFVIPAAAGFIAGNAMVGLMVGASNLVVLRWIKRLFEVQTLQTYCYRFIPGYQKHLVPSHWRVSGG